MKHDPKETGICPRCFLIVHYLAGKVEEHLCIEEPMSQTFSRLDSKLKP